MMGRLPISIISLIILCKGIISLKYECNTSKQIESGMDVANCSSQQLAHVPANLPHNIKVLDLSNNFISQLADYSFYKYEYLEILHLRNNSLTRLETQTFSGLKKLLYLDLSCNNLDEVPSATFLDLKAILTLSLAGNKIRSIQPNSFKDVTKLTNLHLSENHIELIYPEAFQGLINLQRLELQNNVLSALNGLTFQFFSSSFKEVKLYNNPWNCDCNLRWLMQWLKNGSSSHTRLYWKFNSDEPVCKGPSLVQNKTFSSLMDDWFLCPIRMYSKAHDLETNMGSNIELFCKYMADPPVEIRWLKNGKLLDFKQSSKYKIDAEGEIIVTNRLIVYNFQYDDIGEYQCLAENKLGQAFDSCVVTLFGIDPSSVVPSDKAKMEENKRDRLRNTIIVFSTIGGIVIILIVITIVYCVVARCKQYHRKKKESIRISFEENLKANGIIESNGKNKPMIYDVPVAPDKTLSKDSADQNHSVYHTPQRSNAHSSTNTSMVISEPKDMMTLVSTREQQTSNHSKESDGSQCESSIPLLENISPILTDTHNHEPTLYMPRHDDSTNYYLSVPQYDNSDNELSFPQDKNGFNSSLDDSGLAMSSDNTNKYIPHRTSTLPHNDHVIYKEGHIHHQTLTLPRGYSPSYMTEYSSTPVVHSSSVSANHKSASVGHLSMSPPKKPPRIFNSRDTISLHSQTSFGEQENGLKLSLLKPGSVDRYGMAV